jgi:hypothetical protein
MKRYRKQTSGTPASKAVAKSGANTQEVIWFSALGLLLFAVFMGVAHSAEPIASAKKGFQGRFQTGGKELRLELQEARVGASGWISGGGEEKVAECQVRHVETSGDSTKVVAVDLQCAGACFSELSTRASLQWRGGQGGSAPHTPEAELEFGTFLTGYRRIPVHVLLDQLAPIGGPKPRALASR